MKNGMVCDFLKVFIVLIFMTCQILYFKFSNQICEFKIIKVAFI